MRKEPTAEQKERAAAKRRQMQDLCKMIRNMNEQARAELAGKVAGIVTVEGKGLSMHNQCMIASQNPTATIVGGFRQWIKAGRAVRKGEHGITIWCPRFNGSETRQNEETGETERDGQGLAGFLLGTVFDVAQTDEIATAADAAPAAEPVTAQPELAIA